MRCRELLADLGRARRFFRELVEVTFWLKARSPLAMRAGNVERRTQKPFAKDDICQYCNGFYG